MPDGPIAAVSAGWQERESETDELNDVLGGRMRNLELYRRWQQLITADPDYRAAERRLHEQLDEQQELYALRLGPALAAIEAVGRRNRVPKLRVEAEADALRTLQDLDHWHLRRAGAIRTSFYAGIAIGERPSMARQRVELAALVDECAGMIITGGHVGVLLQLLHVFGLAALIKPPVITWSAGAMALSERVVLFHDHGPPGRRRPEVFAEGLGAYSGVLPFPHPRHRLRLTEPEKMKTLARRFAPRRCLLLTDGVRVDLRDGQPLPAGARWINPDGIVVSVGTDG